MSGVESPDLDRAAEGRRIVDEARQHRVEIKRLRAIIAIISENWKEGNDGNFSPSWNEDDAAPGYWLPAENADKIAAALTGG